MTPRHPARWVSCNGIQGDTLVKFSQKFEMFLLLVGGGLLLLHGIAEGVRIVAYLGARQATTAYTAGFAAGEVVATLCFLAAGVGLLWLAWTKRARRAPLA